MHIPKTQDFTISLNPTYRSLRHAPRALTGQGLDHTTIIIVIVAASVGGLFIVVLCWRIFSWLSSRSSSTPLPPRQPLVHHREHQLAAFSEHKNAIIPDVNSAVPIYCGSDVSLVPPTTDSPVNTPNDTSVLSHETGVAIDDNGTFHPFPTSPFFPPQLPPNASSSSLPLPLPSSMDHSFDSGVTSPNQPRRRPNVRPEPRPYSVASIGTSHTGMTGHSRSSVRGAPHSPHSNIQIVLPAPLSTNLHSRGASENLRGQRATIGNDMYSDVWRNSLADSWVSVGQKAIPEPKSMQRQSMHDSVEGLNRPTQRMYQFQFTLITLALNLVL
jgi:hypothetical protein